jgi:hypothetical protein
MKKIKIILTVLLIGAAFGISAFTSKKEAIKKADPVWFQYTPVNGNGPTDPANYTETPGGAACSDQSGVFCSVKAEPDDLSGDEGERLPLEGSLISIGMTYGFDDYEANIVHLDDN